MSENQTPFEPDPDTDYDRQREDALREQAYLEAEEAEREANELDTLTEQELEDVPF